MMMKSEEVLAKITAPAPPRKGETGEHIRDRKSLAKTTAKLVAAKVKQEVVGSLKA